MSMDMDPSVINGRASTATVLVTGGAGVGKTCFVRAAGNGNIAPAGQLSGIWEVGYVALSTGVTVALRTTPDQRRWWWMWDQLATGVFGAVVLVDSTRLAASYPALDYLDARRLPYLVAINRPLGGARNRREIREALRVAGRVPVLTCDATEPASVLDVLHHLITSIPASCHPPSTPLPDQQCTRTKGLRLP